MGSYLLSWKPYVDSIGGRFARIYGMDADDVKQDCWLELIEDQSISDRMAWPISSIKRGAIHAVRRHTAKKRQYSDFSVDAYETDIELDCVESDPVFRITMQRVFETCRGDQVKSFILHNLYGYSLKEVSEMTGVTLDRARRGHEAVREKLREAVGSENR